MKITELKQKGKSESYYVYVNDEFFSMIELEILVKHHVKTGKEITQEELQKIKTESDIIACFNKGLKYISSRLKTEKQLKDYLYKNNFCEQSVDLTIKKLKDYGYLNDEYYAKTYVEFVRQGKGKRYIKNDLKNKGIKDDILTSITDDYNEEDACKTVIKKWLKNKPTPLDKKNKEKLYRYLLSRGFEYETIKHNINLNEDD